MKALEPAKEIKVLPERNCMAGTYDLTTRHKTEYKEDRSNQQPKSNRKHENHEILSRRNAILCKTHPKFIRKDGKHETTIEERNKMGIDERTQQGVQQFKE